MVETWYEKHHMILSLSVDPDFWLALHTEYTNLKVLQLYFIHISWGSRSFFCDFLKNAWLLQQQSVAIGVFLGCCNSRFVGSLPFRKCILLWPCLQSFRRYDKKWYQNHCLKNRKCSIGTNFLNSIEFIIMRRSQVHC